MNEVADPGGERLGARLPRWPSDVQADGKSLFDRNEQFAT
jgi:hypothetical protein